MSSILNDNSDEGGYGGEGSISGGFGEEQRRTRKPSMKLMLFKLVNLMTFHNVVTNTFFIGLLLVEFVQFLGFVFFKINLATTTTSGFASAVVEPAGSGSSGTTSNQSSTPTGMHYMSLAYVSYFNLKQVLMDIRGSITTEDEGVTICYVLMGLSLFIIALNFILIGTLCRYAKDGYDALFASPFIKMMLKACGVIQIIFVKVLALPLIMVLSSVAICTPDQTVAKPNQDPATFAPLDPSQGAKTYSYYYGGYQCWSIPHIVLTAVCLLFALGLTAIASLFALLFNDIRFHSMLPWANASTRACLIKTILKVLIAIALHIEMYDQYALLVCQCANVLLVYLLIHNRWKYFYMADRKVMIVTVL
jgi:hypothetical protein